MSEGKKRISKMSIDSDEDMYHGKQSMEIERVAVSEKMNEKVEESGKQNTEASPRAPIEKNCQVTAPPAKNLFPMFNKQAVVASKKTQKNPKMKAEEVEVPKHQAEDTTGLWSILSKCYEQVSNYKGENSKSHQKHALCKMFKKFARNDVDALIRAYWLSVLKTAPDYKKTELGVGKEILTKAISKSVGKSQKQIRDAFQKTGDLGDVTMAAKVTQKTMDSYFTKKREPKRLTINTVFDTFIKIAQCKGQNSTTERENLIIKLLMDAVDEETKYIVRWIEGNLKISAAEKTMQGALIQALYEINFQQQNQTPQNFQIYELTIVKALAEYPDEQKIIKQLMTIKQDIGSLEIECKITPGVPCKPMLAKPTKEISSVITRFENKMFTCEFKYDGLRGQIHYVNNEIYIYSRNLESLTEAYPDIVNELKKNLKETGIESLIIDSEIIAINPITKQVLPFQTLATRSRKNVVANEITVTVSVFAFDILYMNGPLTHLPLRERRLHLQKIQPCCSNIISVIDSKQCSDIAEIDEYLQQAIKIGNEGLMIKDLDSIYSCSKRSWDWVKLKKDYVSKLGDTLDVVPIGGNYGAGKRAGIFGAYLLAIYNPDLEQYQTICKMGTGFSDEVLEAANRFFSDKAVPKCPRDYRVSSQTEADVWFNPSVVWEIKGADFQISPIYTCGKGVADPNKGIGLRFPRLIRIRDDKKPVDSSNTEFVVDMYKQQAAVQNNKSSRDQDIDDYY